MSSKIEYLNAICIRKYLFRRFLISLILLVGSLGLLLTVDSLIFKLWIICDVILCIYSGNDLFQNWKTIESYVIARKYE